MTAEEFEQTCRDVCPHCAKNRAIRQREDTREFVHDWGADTFGGMAGHAFCLASHFRSKHRDSVSG